MKSFQMLVLSSPLKYGTLHVADNMLQVTIDRSIFEGLGKLRVFLNLLKISNMFLKCTNFAR